MFKKLKESAAKAKKKITKKMIAAQSKLICEREKYDSYVGRAFLKECLKISGNFSQAYNEMKTISAIITVVGIILSIFYLFVSNNKKSKKVLLYVLTGCIILFPANSIVNFAVQIILWQLERILIF